MDLDYFVLNVKGLNRAPQPPPQPQHRRRSFESADDLFSGDIQGGVLGAPPPPEPASVTLEETRLSEKQAHEAARDADNLVAPVMPVTIIPSCSKADYGIKGDDDPVATALGAKQAWGLSAIGADTSTLTGQGVTVAVLDTGIDRSHPAFAGIELVSRNFTGGDENDASDVQGHGTHCAGTIFGRDVEGVRIGVARGIGKAVIGKVLDDNGRGTTARVLKALNWAGEQGAQVVSMSLGFDFPLMQEQLVGAGRPAKLATSMALKAYRENLNLFATLVAFLTQQGAGRPGMVIVAASGNESMRQVDPNFVIDTSLPAAASPAIISVGAFGRSGGLYSIAPFSNINPVLAAPGVDIVSARTGVGTTAQPRLTAMSGTSMACPHVAGVAALWWESVARQVGNANATMVNARIIASTVADGFTADVGYIDRGAGRVMAPR
ncbi:S8 family peptidase [Ancylobacter amanitiformis]|uniref:Subtilisin family serine protease n=1 Tax=Ancylobacter amanitiformis TaxID=217069 RepID=A0ABU0LU04_9HYPH|nr:S8 family serine peptidase [Ancylobacter amanitiformis]MDQ0512159.1 subtilisin family serine protease [Ancylobacter amanitiformis]